MTVGKIDTALQTDTTWQYPDEKHSQQLLLKISLTPSAQMALTFLD